MEEDSKTYGLDEIRAISFFSASLNAKQSVEEVLWGITKDVVREFGFVDCVIYTFDSENKVLNQQAAFGEKNPVDTIIYNEITIPLGKGIVGSVAKNKKAELIGDTSKDARYIVDDENRLSELCVPIMVGNTLFGVIDSEHPTKNFYTERHLHLLTIIAALCAQKIKELGNSTKKNFTRDNSYFKRLEHLMQKEKVYRDPGLSLGSASKMLGISACYLSSMVNAVLDRSFIDYVNGYRILEVKQHLSSDAFDHYTMVSIGLEAGFNSKSTFYSAFKKYTGMTPSQFKENATFSHIPSEHIDPCGLVLPKAS